MGNIDKKLHSPILATDLSTAFDSIDHVTLLRKLEHHGVRGGELELIESYLNNRLQFVEIETFRSMVLHSLPSSTIQGSRLASTMYTLYNLEVPLLHRVAGDAGLLTGLVGHHATSQNQNIIFASSSLTHPCPAHQPQACGIPPLAVVAAGNLLPALLALKPPWG